jgi:hypothetical protein
MAASAATITDLERNIIGSLPVAFLGKHWRHIITIGPMDASLHQREP